MKILLKFAILIVLTTLIFTQCGTQDENVVVTVGDQTITSDELIYILKRKYPDKENYTDIELEKKKELLKPLINKSLHVNEAYAIGLNEELQFQNMLEDHKMRVMGSKYYEMVIIDELVPESEIEKAITRQGVEIKASHILIKYRGTKATQTVTRTRPEAVELINDILGQIQAGADFQAMAVKYSEDPSAKRNKGGLGYFSWGRMVGPFQEEAWKLQVGEISPPVETQFGLHLIKLEDRREVPNFEPDRSTRNIFRMKQMLAKGQSDSARVRWQRHYGILKQKYNYVLYEDSIKYVSNLLKEKAKVEKIIPGAFTSAQREITFVDYDGDKITLGNLMDRYHEQFANMFNKFQEDRILNSEVDRQSMNRLVMLEVKKKGIDKLPEVHGAIKQFSDDQLNKRVLEKQVTQQVIPTEEQLKSYFEANQNKFTTSPKIEIWEVFVKDENVAKSVAVKAKSGADFVGLVKQYSEDKTARAKDGYLGYRNPVGREAVSREAHKMGPGGKIGGPVKFRNGWSVFKTGKLEKGKNQTYEEAKSRVLSSVKREMTNKAKSEWENTLKEKYTVNYDDEKLKAI